MSDDSPTLGDIFGVIRGESSEAVTKQIADSDNLKAIGPVPDALRTSVARLIGGKLADLLDTPLIEILSEGWKGAKAWKRVADNPEEQVVPLNPHTISSKHRPELKILRKEETIATLIFDVEVSLNFENAALLIRDRRIREFRPGTARVEGTLSLSEVKLLKRTSKDYTLPGLLSFDKGIPITL